MAHNISLISSFGVPNSGIYCDLISTGSQYEFLCITDDNIDLYIMDKNTTKKIPHGRNIIFIPKGMFRFGLTFNSENFNSFIYISTFDVKVKNVSVVKQLKYDTGIKIIEGKCDFIPENPILIIPEISNIISNYDEIWDNIDEFMKSIDKYMNILFVCQDYPNLGGASTNTLKMIEYIGKTKKTFGFFINYEKDIFTNYDKCNEKFIIINGNQDINTALNTANEYFGIIDLIIFRSSCYVMNIFNNYACPKYFMFPGIFRDELNVSISNIKRSEIMKFVNMKVLDTALKCDKIYCNSNLTRELLKILFNIESNVFYFNYIPYYRQEIDLSNRERKYKYGVIISKFNRKIKNVEQIKKFYEKHSDEPKIAIGFESNVLSHIPKTFCLDLMANNDVLNYMYDIETIVCASYYESCSNVLVDAEFKGCKILWI